MDRFRQFEKTGNVVVVVDAELCCSVGTLRRVDAGILHHDQACAAFCALLVVINMEETHLSALLAVVCPHGSHHDPVLQRHAANGERFKNVFVLFLHSLNLLNDNDFGYWLLNREVVEKRAYCLLLNNPFTSCIIKEIIV